MLKPLFSATAISLALALSACTNDAANDKVTQTQTAEQALITGQLAYKERIALRGNHVMTVTLSDISIADRKAPVLAKFTRELTNEQVPLPFSLVVNKAKLEQRRRYSVRGTLTDANGNLAWTTDTVHLIDTAKADQNLGTLMMVQAKREATKGSPEKTATYQCGTAKIKANFSDKTVKVTVNNNTYEATKVMSASGAKYERIDERGRVMFWDKGNQALLEVNDKTYQNCKLVTSETPQSASLKREWTVDKLTGDAPLGDNKLTLKFGEDGRLSGFSGCNNYTSSYTVDGESLSLGAVAGTRKACPPELMTLEQNFLKVLSDVEVYKINNGKTLILATSDRRRIIAK